MNFIPPHFYPTTVVFVDDDSHFLRSLAPAIGLEDAPHKTFHDARHALDFINQNQNREKVSAQIMGIDEEADSDNLVFEPRQLMGMLGSADRFNQISVLVIDYEMPDMKGLELCEKLENPFIKKILLTGVADESIAVDAFNRGLIDRYVRKHDPRFLDILSQSIAQLQKNYFQDLFDTACHTLKNRPGSTALTEPSFIKFFEDLVEKKHIKEYYLVEGTGSFVMVGKKQKVHSLITLSDELVTVYLNSSSIETLEPKDVEAIEKKELIPCYYNPFKAPYMKPDHLKEFLHQPTTFKSAQHSFYSVFGEGFIQLNPKETIFWNESLAKKVPA